MFAQMKCPHPQCGKILRISTEIQGKEAICPSCRGFIIIPTFEEINTTTKNRGAQLLEDEITKKDTLVKQAVCSAESLVDKICKGIITIPKIIPKIKLMGIIYVEKASKSDYVSLISGAAGLVLQTIIILFEEYELPLGFIFAGIPVLIAINIAIKKGPEEIKEEAAVGLLLAIATVVLFLVFMEISLKPTFSDS